MKLANFWFPVFLVFSIFYLRHSDYGREGGSYTLKFESFCKKDVNCAPCVNWLRHELKLRFMI